MFSESVWMQIVVIHFYDGQKAAADVRLKSLDN